MDAAWFAATLLLVVYSMALRFNHFQGASWDDGVFLLAGWRTLLGQVPNVDFVSGYPGGFEYLVALAFRLTGLHFAATHWLMGALSLVAAGICHVGLRRHYSPPAACAGASFAFYLFAWQGVASPGWAAQIAFLATALLLARPDFRADGRTLALLGALGGAALYFKQTGIVSLTGVALALGIDFVLRAAPARRRGALAALPHLLPLAVFAASRSASHIPLFIYIDFYPWALMVALLLGLALAGSPSQAGRSFGLPWRHYGELAWLTLVAALCIVPLLAFYQWKAPSLLWLGRKLFVHIPRIVDHIEHAPDLRPPFVLAALLFMLPFLPRAVAAGVGRRMRVLTDRFTRRGSALLALLIVLGALGLVHWLYDLLLVARYSGFIALFVMFILGGLLVPTLVALRGWRTPAALATPGGRAVARVSAYTSVIVVTIFPWSPWAAYITATLFLGYLLVATQWAFPQRWGVAPATVRRIACAFPIAVLLLIVFGFHHDRLARRGGDRRVVTGLPAVEGMLDHDSVRPLIELAREIDRSIPPGEALVTFPSLAFANFAAGRMQASRQGNYFGFAGEDLRAFFDELEQRQVPWFILSPTYFPLTLDHPMLPPLATVRTALERHYRLVRTFDRFEFWRRDTGRPEADPEHPVTP